VLLLVFWFLSLSIELKILILDCNNIRQSRRTRAFYAHARKNKSTHDWRLQIPFATPPCAVARGEKKEEMKKKTLCLVFYAKSSFPDARIIVDPVMRVFILSFATLCMNKALSTPLSTLFRLFFEKRSLRFSFDFLSRAQQRFARRLHRRAQLKQV